MSDPALVELAAGVRARTPGAVARAISLVEDRRALSEARILALLAELNPRGVPSRCRRIGITGPPGVGKSTLVSALALAGRRHGLSVGVLAVDPSSPRSGGALLGDRARMQLDPQDNDLYVRSMASGGQLGGLARAAGAAVEVLSAGFDLVLVETTGVGQSETDVEHVADLVLMVVQPGSGDVLSFLKAGIIEVPDLFVINKADLGDVAARARSDLKAALSAAHAGGRSGVPEVVTTSASTGQGVDELCELLLTRFDQIAAGGKLEERRIRASAAWAMRLYIQRYGELSVDAAGGRGALAARFEERVRSGSSALAVVSAERPAWSRT